MLKPKVPVRRMVFHEITREAIQRALEETREIDERLVDAQETRRILDRLYGYEVSPVLWKKVTQGLSAGRVQSVATRLVVERERERMRFVAARYWDILGTFEPGAFEARLAAVDGTGSPRAATSGRTESRARRSSSSTRSGRGGWRDELRDRPFAVRSVEEKPYTRRPAAPFRTSTLQQEAGRKLRFSSQTTMRVAQRLYENGYITYMRTDSVALSETALAAARAQAAEVYGAETVPAGRGATRGRSPTHRRHTRESGRPATRSARRNRWNGSSPRDERPSTT